MIRCMKSRWIVAGLCGLTAMLVGLRDAEAGSSSITITGGYMPGGGDPPYDYIFNVYLDAPSTPGTNTFKYADSFTIDGLPGVETGSTSNEPSDFPTVVWAAQASDKVLTPGGTAPYQSDFTWTFAGTTTYTATTPPGGPMGASVWLGTFTVESVYANCTTTPFPPGAQVDFTYTLDGGTQTGSGSFQIMSIPEPSSLILLAVGAGVLPLIRLRKQSRRIPEEVAF